MLFARKDRLSGHQTVIIQSENLGSTFIYFCLLCVTAILEAKITSTKLSILQINFNDKLANDLLQRFQKYFYLKINY